MCVIIDCPAFRIVFLVRKGLLVTQNDCWVGGHGVAGWDVAGDDSNDRDHQSHSSERQRVQRCDAKDKALEQAPAQQRGDSEVRLVPAQFVRPFVKSNKNDYRDAEAIAVERENMRFVPIKT